MAQVVVGKKYNPRTGKWSNVYGTRKDSGGSGAKKGSSSSKPKQPIKKAPSSTSTVKKKVTPPKPTKADKGNSHKGSGKKTEKTVKMKTRKIEYDLEGSAEIIPKKGLRARQVVNFHGLGNNFSGRYFLSSVTHTINRGGYTMQLEVLRNNFVWKVPKPKKKGISTAVSKTKGKKKVAPKKSTKKKSSGKTYTVKKNDNLWNIAKRFYGKGALFTKIVNANKGKIKNPDQIKPGQVLVIPPK